MLPVDASVLLSVGSTPATNEAKRNESQHRSYIKRTAAAIVPIAQKYGASVADTLAVCAMVLPSTLGGAAGAAPNMLDLVPLKVQVLKLWAARKLCLGHDDMCHVVWQYMLPQLQLRVTALEVQLRMV